MARPLRSAVRTTPRASRFLTIAEWNRERWIVDDSLPAPSAAEVQALIGRCRPLDAPAQRSSASDLMVFALMDAILARADLGWPVGRALWEHYGDAPSRCALLVGSASLSREGPWWEEPTFAEAALAALPHSLQNGRIKVRSLELPDRVLEVLAAHRPEIAPTTWGTALAWVAVHAEEKDVGRILDWLRAKSEWVPRPEQMLPLLASDCAPLRLWVQLQMRDPIDLPSPPPVGRQPRVF